MKMRLVLLLAAVLSLCGCLAAAEKAEYAATQSFVDALTQENIPYALDGMDEDGCEYVLLERPEAAFPHTVTVRFAPDQMGAALRVWYLISYVPQRTDEVMRVCNMLNGQNRFVSFYADESDNTVSASMDLIFRGSDAGRVTLAALRRLTETLEAVGPLLQACEGDAPRITATAAPVPTATPTPVQPAATPAPAASIVGHTVVITADTAILRSAPNAAGSYVATAKAGERYSCLGMAGDWYAIEVNGRRAYLNAARAELE